MTHGTVDMLPQPKPLERMKSWLRVGYYASVLDARELVGAFEGRDSELSSFSSSVQTNQSNLPVSQLVGLTSKLIF